MTKPATVISRKAHEVMPTADPLRETTKGQKSLFNCADFSSSCLRLAM